MLTSKLKRLSRRSSKSQLKSSNTLIVLTLLRRLSRESSKFQLRRSTRSSLRSSKRFPLRKLSPRPSSGKSRSSRESQLKSSEKSSERSQSVRVSPSKRTLVNLKTRFHTTTVRQLLSHPPRATPSSSKPRWVRLHVDTIFKGENALKPQHVEYVQS